MTCETNTYILPSPCPSHTDDELLEKIQELEKRPYQELNDLERIMLMSRPRSGDINGIKVTIRESSEFKVSVRINEQRD